MRLIGADVGCLASCGQAYIVISLCAVRTKLYDPLDKHYLSSDPLLMKFPDLLRLLFLAAIWGSSFPLMRICAGQFGPLPLATIRVLGGCLFLTPLLLYRREVGKAKQYWKHISMVGLFNSALPFLCYSFAASAIAAGLASVFNATTPLWGALIGRIWLSDRLSKSQLIGLVVGFIGVLYLAWDAIGFKDNVSGWGSALAVVACLTATACYGFSGNYTKKYLKGVPPIATAAGSLMTSSALLVVPASFTWPSTWPTSSAWLSAAGLAFGCTGVAYVVFYRLLENSGATIALAVAYLIPLFAAGWAFVLLGEQPTWNMVFGCLLILVGTSLTTGVVSLGKRLAVSPETSKS